MTSGNTSISWAWRQEFDEFKLIQDQSRALASEEPHQSVGHLRLMNVRCRHGLRCNVAICVLLLFCFQAKAAKYSLPYL